MGESRGVSGAEESFSSIIVACLDYIAGVSANNACFRSTYITVHWRNWEYVYRSSSMLVYLFRLPHTVPNYRRDHHNRLYTVESVDTSIRLKENLRKPLMLMPVRATGSVFCSFLKQ